LPDAESEIFLQTGLDRQDPQNKLICPSGGGERLVADDDGRIYKALALRHSGMRLRSAIADLRRQTRNLEIPGSLALLAPRNDGEL
jgi:hypothetical protein